MHAQSDLALSSTVHAEPHPAEIIYLHTILKGSMTFIQSLRANSMFEVALMVIATAMLET